MIIWGKHNNTLSEKGLLNIIQKTKDDAQEWLGNLSMGKDAYVDEYRQRIYGIKMNSEETYGKLSENIKISHLFKSQPIRKFILLRNLFYSLYETLPLLVTNSNIPTGDILSDPIYEDTTGKYPDLSA